MATVAAGLTMSLDGFVADEDDVPDPMFDWYESGDVDVHWPGNDMVSHVTPASAGVLRGIIDSAGALVVGRRLFDVTSGWGGRHPLGVPVFVVTHQVPEGWSHAEAPFTFITEGVEHAVAEARAVAGTRTVGLAGPNIIQQCLRAGLVDVVQIDLAPVLLGRGIRFFGELDSPLLLGNPTVVEGDRVTHLRYEVQRP